MYKKYWVLLFAIFALSCIKPYEEVHSFTVIGSCKLPGYSKDVEISGNYAYVANDQGGLQVVDISSPEHLEIVGRYLTQKRFVGVAARESLLFIASIDLGGLKIFNISDPSNPVFLGEDGGWFSGYSLCAPAQDTAYVYIAGGYWFIMEDVRNPGFPSFRKRFATPGNARSVFVVDSLAFLACEQMGVYIYDVSKPASSALVSSLDTPANARDLYVANGLIYVADGLGGLCIIDATKIDSLRIIGRYDTRGYAQGVWVENNLCYIADREGGLVVIDVSNPSNPTLYGTFKTPYLYNVKVHDGIIYLVDRDEGLVILREVLE
jgi:hypothetical protein